MPGRYWRPRDDWDGRSPPRQGLPSTTVRGAIFVVAGSPTGQQGPVASLLSTAGWASGAAEVLGRSWVVTPVGVMSAAEARDRGVRPGPAEP